MIVITSIAPRFLIWCCMGVDSSLTIFLIDEEITIYLFVDVTNTLSTFHLWPSCNLFYHFCTVHAFTTTTWWIAPSTFVQDGKGLKFLFPNIVLCKFYIDLLITDVKCELFQELHIWLMIKFNMNRVNW